MGMFVKLFAATAILVGAAFGASASVIVSGATEISKPGAVTNNAPGSNTDMLWFLESKGAVATADREGLGSTGIMAGDVVDTYMIFLNRESGDGFISRTASFEFSTAILGIFGESSGGDLEDTDYFGGTTTYTNFNARGIENGNSDSLSGGGDSLGIAGNTLNVTFSVTQPGDWVRVAVVSSVPLPAGLLLMMTGLGGLAVARKRKA